MRIEKTVPCSDEPIRRGDVVCIENGVARWAQKGDEASPDLWNATGEPKGGTLYVSRIERGGLLGGVVIHISWPVGPGDNGALVDGKT
jgi:hypothetical protein